ncbi:C-C motif chemokine 28-like [Rhinoraja longicauda]
MVSRSLVLLLAVTALLYATAITAMPTHHVVSCCRQVSRKVNKGLLRKVKRFEIQDNQICDLKAVILHKGSLKLCMDSDNALLKRWMSKNSKKLLSRD